MSRIPEINFEEALSDDWSGDFDVQEVALDRRPLFYLGLFIGALGLIVVGRLVFLNVLNGEFYVKRADANLGRYERAAAPRGLIVDRNGKTLVENKAVFSALLDVREFLKNKNLQEPTLFALKNILAIEEEEAWAAIKEYNLERNAEPLPVAIDLPQAKLVAIKELNLGTLVVKEGFKRDYLDGQIFSSVVGYIGLPTIKDLEARPQLTGQDFIGKAGIEAFYEDYLRGTPGLTVRFADAKGKELSVYEKSEPKIGNTLKLTIDADLQKYFYNRMLSGLNSLERDSGVGMAINPKTGEILALINFPTFDNNVFSSSGFGEERKSLLGDKRRPLFNRAVSGLYSPGSTIKPLVGVAALAEKIIDPEKTIFSPGYLDIPNPYNPDKPTRFVDWRFQGEVDLSAALAQSSNVYFYAVGGGTSGQRGLGITRLREWWEKFGLDKETGVDLPGEQSGFLPSIEWKEKVSKRPWLLGDTYNVSIGQGDLQITPIELMTYIGSVANGGKLMRPYLNADLEPEVKSDLSNLTWEFLEVQKGMKQAVDAKMGTALLMNSLPFQVAGKTGSAQINNNAAENAFFVGYAPYEDPEIAILVLVEKAKQGSLNAVPIAKDVLNWYYENRYEK